MTMALANPTLCCWPPLNWSGVLPSYPESLAISRLFATLFFISAGLTFLFLRPKATFSNTVIWGKTA